MRSFVDQRGLSDAIVVDGAGTASWHVGDPPDRRSQQAARARGYDVGGRGQHFSAALFDRFDYIVAMDRDNRDDLLERAPSKAAADKVSLFRDHDPESPANSDVPDPYYGGAGGFERVLDICEAGCEHLLRTIVADHNL